MGTMLEASHISVQYGGTDALCDVSFTLNEHEWMMLIGPNGAGKSTLVKALLGAIPCGGEVTVSGENLKTMKSTERARRIGALAQNHSVGYAFTVEEVVELGRYAYGRGVFGRRDAGWKKSVDDALRLAGLSEMRFRTVFELSGGELQRVFLAQLFAQNPAILLLDEPANHLDLVYQQQIFTLIGEWLKEPGRAVISVVHDLSLAKMYGTKALLLNEGKTAGYGEKQEVFQRDLLREVYRTDVDLWMRRLLGVWNG